MALQAFIAARAIIDGQAIAGNIVSTLTVTSERGLDHLVRASLCLCQTVPAGLKLEGRFVKNWPF